MKTVSSLFLHKVIAQAHSSIDRQTLLQPFGITLNESVDSSKMLKAEDYYSFFENLARQDPNSITLPLRTGASMRCDDYGAFGLAWKSAPTLLNSYQRAERYGRFLTSVSTYNVEETEYGALVHLNRDGERRLGMRLSNEATIASIYSISQQVCSKQFQPVAIFFKHSAPDTKAKHEAHFGCPVHFESDKDALQVSNDTLNLPNKLGDESISRFFDAHLEAELSKREDNSALNKRVKIQISQLLSYGVPTISQVAEQLNMSSRSLHRKLSGLGYSYQQLIDESRRELAERLLKQTNYSLVDIAFMTGFSEQSAFARAFKRWAGQTPRSFRIQSQ